MRILILTQWFDPEPTFKGLLFARELVARGYEVEVLTGFPNYPGGSLYPCYKLRPWMRETLAGVRVLRVALYPSHDMSGLRRALNYVSFAVSAAVIGTALVKKPDVMYVYHPPITVGFAAAVIGFLRQTPFVYDIQDMWPDTVMASGMTSNSAVIALLERLCRFVYRRSSHITVNSPGIKETLVERGVLLDKIDVIYNWCDETVFTVDSEHCLRLASGPAKFTIVFAGTMGTAQGLDSVLEAARLCLRTVPMAEFVFIGGGVDRTRLERMAVAMNLNNVRFVPRQPMNAMNRILAGSDVLLVHLKDEPLFRITIPSKIQAYLASGRPLLVAVRGEAADLVKESQAGMVCEPGNAHSIAQAVAKLADLSRERLTDMGRNGRAFYDKELSLSIGVARFDAIFKAVLNETSRMRHRQMGRKHWLKASWRSFAAICVLTLLSPLLISAILLLWLWCWSRSWFSQDRAIASVSKSQRA